MLAIIILIVEVSLWAVYCLFEMKHYGHGYPRPGSAYNWLYTLNLVMAALMVPSARKSGDALIKGLPKTFLIATLLLFVFQAAWFIWMLVSGQSAASWA